jgi:hypothetical protein
MRLSKRFWLNYVIPFTVVTSGLVSLASCVPVVDPVPPPTLNEVRSGTARGQITEDPSLRPGEILADVTEIDRARRELRVLTADGRRHSLAYDPISTKVFYHGRDYTVDHLEAGDRIAYLPAPRNSSYVDTIRIQEPVQARAGRTIARPTPPPSPRRDVVEGTVERINYDLGVFDIRPTTGRTVTVSLPYNARAADVDNFRSLRRGDHVRVEGEFVNPESLQLLAFLSPR